MSMVANRIASRLPRVGALEVARLHDRRVQVEIVRHDGGTEDADGEVEHRRIGDDLGARHQPVEHGGERWLRQRQLDDEAEADHDHQRHHQRLELAKAARLQGEHQQHFDAGQGDAEGKVEAEQQLERDRRADQLGKVAGDDGELAQQPEEHPGRGAVALRGRPARDRGR